VPHVCLLIAGGSAQRRLIETTTAKLAAKGYEQISRREGGDWHALLTENRSAGLFASRSVIQVEGVDQLGSFPAKLAPFLEPDGASVVILLICKSESENPIPKDLQKQCSLIKAPAEPSPWSKERDAIITRAMKTHGVSVTHDAVSLLKDLFDDTGELASEADKLALYCQMTGKKEAARRDVEAFCLTDGSRGLLKLLDGFCSGSYAQCLENLELLREEGELLPLLSALHNRTRLALYACAFPAEKQRFAKALAAKDYAWRNAESAARLYGKEKLLAFTVSLIRINANEKSGQGSGWRDLFIELVTLMGQIKKK